ncbi:unnamed protein product [Haemonchus placei]|uniref:Secreted protein n=1 Tax=Haemonchus placei TaxID=6290 RepID=A0A0N4WX15_HAEPC|nr:unnamed protein product [Haemonchus placei]
MYVCLFTVLILSHFRAEVAASGGNHTIAKRQSKYICGTEPYRFFSDVREYFMISFWFFSLFIPVTSF